MRERLLVIQLARVGDVIQTTPLLADLHRSKPEAKIELLVLAGNDAVVVGMPGISRVITIPEAHMQRMNEEVAQAMGSRGPTPLAEAWLAGSGLSAYGEVYNVSAQWLGCWLMRQLEARDRIGGLLTEVGEWIYTCDWGTYLAAMLDFRDWNRINLVDLFRGFGAPSEVPGPGFRPYLARDTRWVSGLPSGIKIGFNPGASEPQRRYNPEAFLEVIRRCMARGHLPVLLGSPMDQALCDQIAAACGGIPNFAGRTRIPEMAQLLSELSLVVSNDTGAVHMAAAVGTPVVGLFGVSAFFHETGPWGEGHLVLQAPLGDQASLLDSITPDLVVAAIDWRLRACSRENFLTSLRRCRGVEAWESERITEPEDPLGGVRYVPVCPGLNAAGEAEARRLRRSFAVHLARQTGPHVGSTVRASESSAAVAAAGVHPPLAGRLGMLSARAHRLSDLAASDPQSAILHSSFQHLQIQIGQTLEAEAKGTPGQALLGFLRWKLKMTGAEAGLSGVLNHQHRVLSHAADWIRAWDEC